MLYIASDHAGFDRKKMLKTFFQDKNIDLTDLGPQQYNEQDDYPDYALPLARVVAKNHGKGILLCGNGVGVCVAANKVQGIRAGIGYSEYAAKSMREDDDTNILCLPSRFLSDEEIQAITQIWLQTPFSGHERHQRR